MKIDGADKENGTVTFTSGLIAPTGLAEFPNVFIAPFIGYEADPGGIAAQTTINIRVEFMTFEFILEPTTGFTDGLFSEYRIP